MPLPARVTIDWLTDGGVTREPEREVWDPKALTGPWTFGRHPWIRTVRGRPFIWSNLSETRFPAEILEPGPRRMVLDGFPAPSPDGLPQRVDVLIDGRRVGSAEWSGPARRVVDVPREALAPGLHRVVLRYRYTADDSAGGPGSQARGMAWHAIAWQRNHPPPPAEIPGGRITEQGPSVWWRFVPVSVPATFRVRGRALAPATRAVVLVDRGSGVWERLARAEADSSGGIALETRVTGESGGAVRLGLAVLRGAVAWDSVRSVIAAPARRPPIVLVTLDTTRRDALGCYEAGRETPNLDRLAREGTVWDAAFTPTPATGPAHATVLLSRYPYEHGFRTNGQSLPHATGGNLVAQVKALGYDTAGFVSLGTVAADLGFAQEFDTFDDEFDHGWWRFATAVNRSALPWIAAHPQGPGRTPAFLWVHYSDPHRPYGTADEPGQGIRILVNGAEVVHRAPTLGLEQSWPVTLQPGDNEIALVSPEAFHDDRESWYVLRDRSVDSPRASVVLGEGWTRIRGFPRMKARGTLRVRWKASSPGTATFSMRLEDDPTPAEARRRYDREVTAEDTAVGDLLGALDRAGWLKDGLIFVFADHGEDLGENGQWGHIQNVGPILTHVPMILWGKGVPAGRLGRPVVLMDIAPTLAARLRIPPSPLWRGVDALEPPARRVLYLETFPPEAKRHFRGVVDFPVCAAGVVENGPDSLVFTDIRTGAEIDPGRRAEELRRAWERWIGKGEQLPAVEPEVRERLRALGYLQ